MRLNLANYCDKAKTYISTRLFKARPDNVFSYQLMVDCKDFQVYKRKKGAKRIESACEGVVVLSRKNRLFIYPDYRYPMMRYSVTFNSKNFPDLINGSRLAYCRILPYYRSITPRQSVKSWRLMVVTDKGQIYHNYPSRAVDCDGNSFATDIIKFEESAVWDLPGRRYPSPISECSNYERYYPGLPDEAYKYYPSVNKKSHYGNCGFKATYDSELGTLSRFYIPRREPQGNPFYYMSGFEADRKMAVLATYRGNVTVGVRTCVFMSSDGGRQWFCKYEFGDLGEYAFKQGHTEWGKNFGNAITYKDGLCTNVYLSKRNCHIPNAENKEPAENFDWECPVDFNAETKDGVLILRSDSPHKYQTGNIVAVTGASSELSWMCNAEVNENSAGNGLLFKVDVIDANTVRLYEYVASPDNPISCRHIHHVSRVRDGWIVGTGEIYPNSWLLYIQMKEADTFSVKSADAKFDVYRLNSSEKSVQRTLGVLWQDDEDNTFMYASDQDVLENKKMLLPIKERSISFSRNATGIYAGKLENIDDYDKFLPIYETREPAYVFKKIRNVIVFLGQGGEIALSFDEGKSWSSAHIDTSLFRMVGETYQYQVFEDYILKIK